MELHLAWRNIWRNPRRTAVIMTAVIIGVWSMVGLGALMRGVLEGMIENSVDTLTGHVQIHQEHYPDDPAIEHSITEPAPILETLESRLPVGSHWARRVRLNTVASNARHTLGATLVGIDPQAEARLSFIGDGVSEGRYLEADDRGAILVGRALAERFETRLGRKLILTAQNLEGEIVSRAFRVRGIFRAEMEATEKSYLFITRQAAQEMLGLGGSIEAGASALSAIAVKCKIAYQ